MLWYIKLCDMILTVTSCDTSELREKFQFLLTENTLVFFLIVAPYIPKSIYFTHQQMHYLLNLESLKFTLKYTQMSLLRVSVYDHHQGACTEPG